MPINRTVLVIADSDESDKDYKQQLQQDESVAYRILSEHYSASIPALSRLQQIDGILLELGIPHSNSIKLLRQLKEQMGDRCPPIVVIDSGDTETAVQAFKNGAVDYLVRGQITSDDLRLAMQSAIDNAELRRELQRSQAQFQTSVENMLDCFGIFSAIRDELGQIVDFRIDYLNEAAANNNRMPKAVQIGRGLCELLPAHRESGLFDEYCRVVEKGEPLIKDSLIYDDTYGDRRLIRAFDIRATKLNDGFVASWRDVTNRRQMELELSQTVTALQASQQRYRDLAEAMPQIVWTADATGAINYWNQRWYEYTGLRDAEAMGVAGVCIVHPDDRDHTLTQWSQAIVNGESFEIEYRIRRWSGEYHWFINRAVPTIDSQSQITGWIGTITDIDSQKRLEAKLLSAIENHQSTEEDLRRGEERLRLAQLAADAGHWEWDIKTSKVFWSPEFYALHGIDPAVSASYENWLAIVLEADRERADQAVKATLASNQSEISVEYRVDHPIRGVRWLLAKGQTRFAAGQPEAMIGFTFDISDRKQAEIALQRNQERLDLAMKAAKMGSWDWEIQTGKVNWSTNLEYLFGMASGSFDGRYETVRAMIHPDDLPWVEQAMHRAHYEREDYNIEFRFIKPDGTVRWALGLGRVFYDSSGNPVTMTGVDLDISERKQAEAALRASEKRFRDMADNAPVMIWVTDAKGYCTYLNQGWYDFTGQTEEAGLGLGWLDAVHPEDRESAKTIFLNATKHQEVFRVEYRLQRKDGEYRWAIDTATPWFGDDGEFYGYIGSVIDISDHKQAEEALRLSEERYRTLFESMNEGFCVAEVLFDEHNKPIDYRLLEINSVFEKHSGLKDAQGKTARELHPELEQYWIDLYGKVALTGEPARYENYSEALGRWFDVSAFRIGQPDSRKVAILFEDISQRKQTEAALQASEERYRSLIEATAQIIWNELGDRGEFMSPQPAWSAFTGQTYDELKGWGWLNAVHPDDRAATTQAWLIALENRALYEFEHRVRRHDGVYRHMSVRAVPVFEENGTIREWVGVHTDISDRKQAEEALRQSEDRLRLTVESAELGTWDFNPITNVLKWDDQCKAMFGLPPTAKITWDVFLAGLHSDDRERTRQVVLQSFDPKGGGDYDIEYRTVGLEDGIERWVSAKGKAFFNSAGVVIRFIGTVLNITEKKQAEAEREQLLQREQAARAEAERANRIKDEFLAVLSHELRSPLNPILGWTKLLQMRKFDEAQTSQALATIERNARLQTQLIDDLLDVAKILRGKLSLNMASVNLSSVVEAAIETVRTAADTKSISLHSVLSNIGQVSGDTARLQQIVWNLLSNAIKFTPNGGLVNIRLEQVGNQAMIIVSDTGRGINPEFLPHIFESFRQEDASITRKYGGLGLGLAIVRQLVEAHGGTITVDSPGEGLGATFTVQLPLLNIAPQIKPADELTQPKLDLTGIRVLAVDDDPDARELLAVLLTQYGANVLTVASASEVLANLESFQPDVLVSDIGMPEIDGYSLIKKVRNLPAVKWRQIPAIALTAYAREDDHQQAINSGYQRHVTKPLEPERLIQAVVTLTRNQLNRL